jgi:flagellar basal-body rod protein FlgB
LQEVSQTLDIERNKVKSIQSHLQLHSEALALRSKRNEILASNIANAATPNFKAKDLDFSSMLNAKMGIGDLMTNDLRHLNSVSTSINDGVGFRQNITPSMDGNTVELHVEQMQFSENVMRYQASLEFLNRKLTGLKSAIKGE